MNMFIQNSILLATTVADKSAEITAKTGKVLTTWDKVEMFYTAHSTLIDILVAFLVVAVVFTLLRLWGRFFNKNYDQASLDNIADELSRWFAPQQTHFALEELKTGFLLLLQGKYSGLLSGIVRGLKCKYTELGEGLYSFEIQVFYQGEQDALQKPFSRQMRYEDIPSEIRREFNMKNCQTIVFDYLKQTIEESK